MHLFGYLALSISCKRTEADVANAVHVLLYFQLKKMLQEVREVSLGDQGCSSLELFLSKCALFVGNKWDAVPGKDKKAVKNHVTRELQKCWPGLDPESQIIYMSTKDANVLQKCDFIAEGFCSVMNSMKTVILTSIEARLEFHWA